MGKEIWIVKESLNKIFTADTDARATLFRLLGKLVSIFLVYFMAAGVEPCG